jgi:hypothetical protein
LLSSFVFLYVLNIGWIEDILPLDICLKQTVIGHMFDNKTCCLENNGVSVLAGIGNLFQ